MPALSSDLILNLNPAFVKFVARRYAALLESIGSQLCDDGSDPELVWLSLDDIEALGTAGLVLAAAGAEYVRGHVNADSE